MAAPESLMVVGLEVSSLETIAFENLDELGLHLKFQVEFRSKMQNDLQHFCERIKLDFIRFHGICTRFP